MLKVKSFYNFLTKQVKKWDQNVSRAKNFSLFIVKFKKSGFSDPLSSYKHCVTNNCSYRAHNISV